MTTAKQKKKERMDELFYKARERLGSEWFRGWLCYFYGFITIRQTLSYDVIDALEHTLNEYTKMQAISDVNGQPIPERVKDEKAQSL